MSNINNNVDQTQGKTEISPDPAYQQELIDKVLAKQNLSKQESRSMMGWFSSNVLAPEQIAMILTALRMKGECAEEIAGIAEEARAWAIRLPIAEQQYLIDIVGTGGDSRNTFNISTAAAIVAAGAGAKLAKHGNRAVSSLCGSADVLEALGVRIDHTPEKMAEMLDGAGMCFMFAPVYHPAMKYVAPVRKAMKSRTVFNILGPLINPAFVAHIVLGVYDRALLELMADVLIEMGIKRAMVVHSDLGMDELSLDGKNFVIEIHQNTKKNYTIEAAQYFPELSHISPSEIASGLEGGDSNFNARLIERILSGKGLGDIASLGECNDDNGTSKSNHAARINDIVASCEVVLNAGLVLYTCEKVSDISEGIAMAKESIASGAALRVLEKMRTF